MKIDYEWLDKDKTEWENTEKVYQEAKEKLDWDTIFKCTHRYCTAYVVKFLSKKYVVRDDLPELALDATILIVDRIKRRGFPNSLKNYCYFPTMYTCFGRKRIKEDNDFAISYEEIFDEDKHGDDYSELTGWFVSHD